MGGFFVAEMESLKSYPALSSPFCISGANENDCINVKSY